MNIDIHTHAGRARSDPPAGVAASEMPDFCRHPDISAALRDRRLTFEEVV
jgi:hypothetical protein